MENWFECNNQCNNQSGISKIFNCFGGNNCCIFIILIIVILFCCCNGNKNKC